MRLRLAPALFLLAAMPGSAMAAGPTAPVPNEAAIRLANHRAVYDLSLARSEGTRAVEGVRGRIVIDFSGDACRGYTMQTRQVTMLNSGESGDRTSDLRSTTFENGDGKSFRFRTTTVLNNAPSPAVDGTAEAADALKVKLKEPKRDQFQAEGAVLFPIHHMIRLIEAAKAGETTVSAKVFDGSDDGRKVYDTLAIIGRPNAAPAADTERDKPLREGDHGAMRRWPVTLSYFTAGAGERTPIYTLTFDLYEDGVSGRLHLDYGDFAIDGNLTRLDLAKADPKADPTCKK
ncbi:cell envelope integrity EipB family protein [Methylorubrum extorquens]|uniref:cell envelope integrity EipB family protein n=1 Tax=Methylorubrum extorquens TaxID=408 RepID=UPI001EE5A785|nr:cell envelope integrity EipB family protein [Methylorubrum extorquens]MCG5247154.1 cell envelope integrity EipB family protein [Methylorubrum extorquens]